jgi:hypothetical protein
LELDVERQRRENRLVLALGRHQDRDALWGAFQQMRDVYLQAVDTARAQGDDPTVVLPQAGINPPTVAGILRQAEQEQRAAPPPMQVPGLPGSEPQQPAPLPRFPTVEEGDNHATHIMEIDAVMKGDAWDSLHPLVQQGFREMRGQHLQGMHSQMQSLGTIVGGGNPQFGGPGNEPGGQGQDGPAPNGSVARPDGIQKMQAIGG